MTDMFNYCRYSYQKESVELISQAHTHLIPARSLQAWMDQTAISFGSTLRGRQKSFSVLMARRKFLPAVLCEDPPFVLVPVTSLKEDDAIFLNYAQIVQLQPYLSEINGIPTSKAKVRFCDGQILDLEHPQRLIDLLVQIDLYLRGQQARRDQLKKLPL